MWTFARPVAAHRDAAPDGRAADASVLEPDQELLEKVLELQRDVPTIQATARDGKITLNVLPFPTSLDTSIRPPCASTIRRAM